MSATNEGTFHGKGKCACKQMMGTYSNQRLLRRQTKHEETKALTKTKKKTKLGVHEETKVLKKTEKKYERQMRGHNETKVRKKTEKNKKTKEGAQ